MQDKHLWMRRSKELLAIASLISKQLREESNGIAPKIILSGMFSKGINTFDAVKLLYLKDHPESAQILVRVLFELRLDFAEFITQCQTDAMIATRRVLDAMMLEKIKQQKSCNFVGPNLIADAPTPEEMLQNEKEISSRYEPSEVKKLRRFGFSGMSIEDRAKKYDLLDVYNIIYRNFSRNVHSTDYAEYYRKHEHISRFEDYEDYRDHVSMSSAITTMWRISYLGGQIAFLDRFVASGLFLDLLRISRKCTNMRHWISTEDRPAKDHTENAND